MSLYTFEILGDANGNTLKISAANADAARRELRHIMRTMRSVRRLRLIDVEQEQERAFLQQQPLSTLEGKAPEVAVYAEAPVIAEQIPAPQGPWVQRTLSASWQWMRSVWPGGNDA